MRKSSTIFPLAIALLAAACGSTDNPTSTPKFMGADNQSAILTFETTADVPLVGSSPDDLLKGYALSTTREQVELQVQHLYGTFSTHPDYVDNPGVIRGDDAAKTIKILGATASTQKGYAAVRYRFTDHAVFKKSLLSKGKTTIDFVLPRTPSTIYSPLCTDDHYTSIDDFWYFWNPFKDGCPITDDQLVHVTGHLTPIPNTTKTYPDYNALLGDNGNGRLLSIVMLVGIDENMSKADFGRQTFEEALTMLIDDGFALDTKRSTKFDKILVKSKPDFAAQVRLALLDQGSLDFVRAAKDGLENADLFIYTGHSGLGGYLPVDRFDQSSGGPLKLSPTKSQIFFFNGCTTYSYYNLEYFKAKNPRNGKAARRNLDIVTSAIGASFGLGPNYDVILIKSLTNNRRPSWQTIMNNMYEYDTSLSALTHVNGDEENPTTPR